MPLSFDALVVGPCIAAFGEGAQDNPLPLYAPVAGTTPFSIDGVFDNAYREVESLTNFGVISTRPVLGVQLSSFPACVAPAQGDRVTIRQIDYLVDQVRVDSHGHALLLLNIAS